MANAVYVAQRGLVSYHEQGASYSIDFDTSDVTAPGGDDLKTRQESLNGNIETNYYGERLIWSITSIPVQRSSALALLMREFLRSTADGQQFTFDPYGGDDNPVEPLSVVREDDGFKSERFMEIGGPSDYVRYTFSVREV